MACRSRRQGRRTTFRSRGASGLFPLEAMAAGVPVVHCRSANSAVSELVRDGREGWAVDPDEGELAALLERFARRARRTRRRFELGGRNARPATTGGKWPPRSVETGKRSGPAGANLRGRVQGPNCCSVCAVVGTVLQVEVSAGELIDKITILEIKAERIADPDKVANVERELRSLAAARSEALPSSAELDELTAELRRINERLWEIEDDIRDCERKRDFGERFVELARAVYRTNDRRAAAKTPHQRTAGLRARRREGLRGLLKAGSGSLYQVPSFGIEAHGSSTGSEPPSCSSSIEIPSGDRMNAMRPSRGGRLITTPCSCSDRQVP